MHFKAERHTAAMMRAMNRETLAAKYDRRLPRYTSYPTAPHFHVGVTREVYRAWLADLPRDMSLSLYFHVPFCRSLCWFCGCNMRVVRRNAPLRTYCDTLIREVETVIDALGSHRQVDHVHFGGGTPTILPPELMQRLAEHVRAGFAGHDMTEWAIEIDPRTLSDETVETLAALGFTRASLGVQDLSARVQRAINRIQPYDVTADAVARLRGAGITAINIDLMYGLPHQSLDDVVATVDQVIGLAPARIALFGYAHVPWMKRHQRLIDDDALPGSHQRLRQFDAVYDRLRAADYQPIGLDHFARADDPLAVAAAAGTMRRNFQGYTTDRGTALLGFGASAIGALPQGYVQSEPDPRAYVEAIDASALATVRGRSIDDDDRLRRAIIEQLMCALNVDVAALCDAYDVPTSHFQSSLAPLDAMAADGLVRRDGWRIQVTEAGRPFVRAACAAFDAYLRDDAARHAKAI